MRSVSIIFLLLSFCANAQFERDYAPLQPAPAVPAWYLTDVDKESLLLAQDCKLLNPVQARSYFVQVLAAKKMVFESGDTYLPNKLTLYVDSLVSALVQTEPVLKDRLHVFLTRYGSPNAFCLADGSIFVNLGLISRMENESQLAFVLAHEIAHYHQQHSLKDFLREYSISKQESFSNVSGSEFRKLRISRESEQEADSYALSMMNAAGFDINQATAALQRIKPVAESELIDYKSIFTNSFFTLDSVLLTREMVDKVKDVLKYRSQDSPDRNLDDLYDTHPDLDKRIGTVNELLRNIKAGGSRTSSSYSYYRTLTSFEMCYNFLREQDYLNTVLQVIKLQKQYPDNIFLTSCISSALYWLSYYKELSQPDLRVYGDFHQDPLNFSLLYLMYDKMSLKSSKQLAYAWLRSRENEIENYEAPFFYLAVSAENYLGKIAARDFYRRYAVKFSSGEHISYVKTRMQ